MNGGIHTITPKHVCENLDPNDSPKGPRSPYISIQQQQQQQQQPVLLLNAWPSGLMPSDSHVYVKSSPKLVKKLSLFAVVGILLLLVRNPLAPPSPSALSINEKTLRTTKGSANSTALQPNPQEPVVPQSRAEALACFERLFQTTHEQFVQNANADPAVLVLNSVHINPLNPNELVLFLVLDRHSNIRDHHNDLYRNGTFWCDHKVPARVMRHTQVRLPQLKMYCPATTKTLAMEIQDNLVLRKQLTFDLQPFLACDSQYLLPPNAANQKIAACTAVKGASMYDLLPQWIEYHRMIGIGTFWVHVNDKMENFYQQAPEVAQYFQRQDVQQYASVLPYEWNVDDVEPFFARAYILLMCLSCGMLS